jgi:hypothetical protein
VRSPCLAQPVDLELPRDVPLARLRPALLEALRLPAGEYVLLCGARPLGDEEDLSAAGVLPGDVLDLLPAELSEKRLPPAAAPAPPPGPPAVTRAVPARCVAFWSGPAGGTGRTTLATALALWAASTGRNVLLLALAEPAVSLYLRLPRSPDLGAFFQASSLAAALQEVTWQAGERSGALRVALGCADRAALLAEEGEASVAALLEAARAACSLLLIDLPARGVWAAESLRRADDVVLVCPPTARGVTATVAALAALEGIAASARVLLALVRCGPAGFAAHEVVASVRGLWRSSPPLAVEVPYLPNVAAWAERGELLEALFGGADDARRQGERLAEAAGVLLEAIAAAG